MMMTRDDYSHHRAIGLSPTISDQYRSGAAAMDYYNNKPILINDPPHSNPSLTIVSLALLDHNFSAATTDDHHHHHHYSYNDDDDDGGRFLTFSDPRPHSTATIDSAAAMAADAIMDDDDDDDDAPLKSTDTIHSPDEATAVGGGGGDSDVTGGSKPSKSLESTGAIDSPDEATAVVGGDSAVTGGSKPSKSLDSTDAIDSPDEATAVGGGGDSDATDGSRPSKISDESEEKAAVVESSGEEEGGADRMYGIGDGILLSPTVLLSNGFHPSKNPAHMERSRSLDAGLHIINAHTKHGISCDDGAEQDHIVTGSDPSGLTGSNPSGLNGSNPSGLTGSDRSGLNGSDRPEVTSFFNRSASASSGPSSSSLSSSTRYKRTETYEEFTRRIETTMRNHNYMYEDDRDETGGNFLSGVLEETESFAKREFGPSGAPNYMDLRSSANHHNKHHHHHQSSSSSSSTSWSSSRNTRGGGARGPLGGIVVSVVRHRSPRPHGVSIIDLFLWPFRKIRNGYMGCMWIADDTTQPWRFA